MANPVDNQAMYTHIAQALMRPTQGGPIGQGPQFTTSGPVNGGQQWAGVGPNMGGGMGQQMPMFDPRFMQGGGR